jgi:NADH dehydrogenase/NADH:ubiquinone oxidoreductase subunit G
MQMGCLAGTGPGYTKAKKAGKAYDEMKKGMKSLFIAGNVPDADFRADMIIVQASHANALTEKADLVLPLAALYEKQGTITNTYGTQKVFGQAHTPAADIKSGVEAAAELSAAISKTKAFKAKDIASLVKKVKSAKMSAGVFKPVKASAASKPYGKSATVLLMAMNQGMLGNSGVIKVMVVGQPALQR